MIRVMNLCPLSSLPQTIIIDYIDNLNRLSVPRCHLRRTTIELFITPASQSGTRCHMNIEILTVLVALNDS